VREEEAELGRKRGQWKRGRASGTAISQRNSLIKKGYLMGYRNGGEGGERRFKVRQEKTMRIGKGQNYSRAGGKSANCRPSCASGFSKNREIWKEKERARTRPRMG